MEIKYILSLLLNFDKLPVDGKWYKFETEKHSKDDLIEVVKLRIDLSGDFIISNDYKYFKKIKVDYDRPDLPRNATYTIEWRDINEVQFDYSHLPPPKFSDSKKYRDYFKGRDIPRI